MGKGSGIDSVKMWLHKLEIETNEDEALAVLGAVKQSGLQHSACHKREKANSLTIPCHYSIMLVKDYAWLCQNATPERIFKVRQLTEVARELGASVAQLAWPGYYACLKSAVSSLKSKPS